MFGVMPNVVISGILRIKNTKNLSRRDLRINTHKHGMVDNEDNR